jgi:hypothetical protein
MIRNLDRRVIIAATAFSAAALVFAAVLAGALRTEPLPDLPDPAADVTTVAVAEADPTATAVERPLVETATPETPMAERPLTSDALALAADQDPFQPDRRRPQPYMLPGEAVEVRAPPPRPELPPPPDFRVLGTIVTANGGAALVQIENEPPRIVNRGEALQGYRLDRIELDAATLVNRDRSLRLAVVPPEPREQNARGRRGNNNNNRGNNNNNARGRANTAAQRALEQRAQQLQQMGVPPEMIERLMQQGAGRGGGDAVFSFSTDDGTGRVMVRGSAFEIETGSHVPVVQGRVGGTVIIRGGRGGRGGGGGL